MAKRPHLDELLVQLTIPAHCFSKRVGTDWRKSPDTFVRQALDEAFRVSLGRCEWKQPLNITCTLAQFGFFVALLQAKDHGNQIIDMTYEVFRPDPSAGSLTYVVTDSQPKGMHHVQRRAAPVTVDARDG
ncbi:hypothetical protein vBCbaSRXM_47 [Citromicrobium phage vB_CbaS-RXM]|nr:hypothetical protein vBCbaSRXM_47 [Citromicrobium phage vB_CbaS-RXM]